MYFFLTILCFGLIFVTFWFLEPTTFGTSEANRMRALRNGEAISCKDGSYMRLNLKTKTLQFDGENTYVGDDYNLFPRSESERLSIEAEESFRSHHPLTYEMQNFINQNKDMLSIIFGCILVIYLIWRLLKFIIRELFFTAAKAIQDAKNSANKF